MADDSMHEMVAQQRLQGEILDLATQISTGHDEALDSRKLDTYLFLLPTGLRAVRMLFRQMV